MPKRSPSSGEAPQGGVESVGVENEKGRAVRLGENAGVDSAERRDVWSVRIERRSAM